MKTMSAALGLCATTAVVLAGCSATKSGTTSQSTSAAASPPAVTSTDGGQALKKTIADYVAENKIVESPVNRGDADSPAFDFPMPPGWRAAGNQKPEWAYGAIVYDKAEDPADPPFMTAIVTKLTGNVDAAKILEYAPGMLQNLPGYQQDGEVQKSTLSGFEAIQFQGSYLRDAERRYIAQKTVVIPRGDGGLFVLQLNADAPAGQDDVVRDAAKVINADTKITA